MSSGLSCPYCGEAVEVYLDPGGGEHQDLVEDCAVCCRPIRFVADYSEESGEYVVSAQREG